MRRTSLSPMVLMVVLLASHAATAATGKTPWDDFGKRVKSSQQVPTLGPDLMGDQVSHSNGALGVTSFLWTELEFDLAARGDGDGHTEDSKQGQASLQFH